MKRQVLSLLLTALLFASCSKTGTPTETSSDSSGVSETAPETIDISPQIPAVDYEGYTFSILTTGIAENETAYHEVYSEGQTGEAVNDAVYARNMAIAEKYNIIMEGIYTGLFDYSTFTKAVVAGDDVYDVIMPNQVSAMQFAGNGYLQEITSIPHLDFTKPWWLENSVSETSLYGRNFFAVGDMNLASWESTPVLFYNKDMAASYNVDNLYTVVDAGKWTYDTMLAYCSNVSTDLNGNGEFDADDAYGLALNSFSVYTMTYGGGFRLIDRDADDLPVIDLSEDFITFMQRHIQECNNNPAIMNGDKLGKGDVLLGVALRKTAFQENRVLFYNEMLTIASTLREMETDFGVLPMPKSSEAQEQYYSFFHKSNSSTIAVPVTSVEPERIGSVIEDMQYQSHLLVRPAYLESTVKGKVMRDMESERMLDLVLSNIIFDTVLDPGILDACRPLFNTANENLMSELAGKMNTFEKTLQEYIDAIQPNA